MVHLCCVGIANVRRKNAGSLPDAVFYVPQGTLHVNLTAHATSSSGPMGKAAEMRARRHGHKVSWMSKYLKQLSKQHK